MGENDQEEEVSELLKNLSLASEDERVGLLKAANSRLQIPDAEKRFRKKLEVENLDVLFDCLNTSDESCIKAASQVLNRVFEFMHPSVTVSKYSRQIKRGLEHPQHQVKVVLVNAVIKALEAGGEARDLLLLDQGLVVACAKSLMDPHLSVSQASRRFLLKLSDPQINAGHFLFTEPLLNVLKDMMLMVETDAKDELKLRLLDVIVTVSNANEKNLMLAAQHGFLDVLFQLLDKEDDVLVQLNALELLTQLVESQHGHTYLKGHDKVKTMDLTLNRISSGSLWHFLMPGYLKFFGRISYFSPQDFATEYPNFTSLITGLLSSDDIEEQCLALEAICHIALRSQAKLFVANSQQLTGDLFVAMRRLLSGTTDQKVRALTAFSDLLKIETETDEETTEQFFKAFDPLDSMAKLHDLLKQPFSEVASATFKVASRVALYEWGLRQFSLRAGFFEYLLDRSTAKDKAAKENKYELVKAIAEHDKAHENIVPEIMAKMKLYVKQGPFYVEAIAEVAMDED